MEMRPETAGTREKEGKALLLILVVGRWLKYMKADYNYQPFLRPCKKEYE